MELRRIIKFGNSSFVVSLPKTWVDKNSLGKGDFLYFNENGNNELIISPRDEDKKRELVKVTIDVNNKPIKTIRRELMAAYIGNTDIIKITGNLAPIRQDIDSMLHKILALEIMEDTPEKIVIKDFLNLNDLSLKDIIRRIDVMVRVMMNDVETSFSKNLYDKLNQMDISVNKLMYMVYRVIRRGMKDPSVLKSLKMNNNLQLLDCWMVTHYLEALADEAKRTTRFMKKQEISKEEMDDLKQLFQKSRESYIKVMKALYTRDMNLAHEVASGIDDRTEKWNEIFNKSNSKTVGPLIERFKAIEGNIRSLARTVVDRGADLEKDANEK